MTGTGHPLPPISGNGDRATVSLLDYLEAIRAGDLALDKERDRRYQEVKDAEEKALKVKEKADETALGLDREIRAYKDEKANNLRDQIERERGGYATKDEVKAAAEKMEALIKPVSEYVSGQQGRKSGGADARLNINTAVGVLGLVLTALIIYGAFHR